MFSSYADILFNLPLKQSYTYHIPEEFIPSLQPGMRVELLFRNREEIGIVESIHRHPPQSGEKILSLSSIADSKLPLPLVNSEQIELAHWMAKYYLCAPGEALFKTFPKPTSFKQTDPVEALAPALEYKLNREQQQIYERIKAELKKKDKGAPSAHVLHGITGSGKTEIYIHFICEALQAGKSALLLVPEISLTVQLIQRLKRVFGESLALLHSGLQARERFTNYMQVLTKEKKIAVGTRSAVFAPLEDLALIILDEEHDSSFKENSTPRYDARQIALRRAEKWGSLLLLGSATPRLEAVYHARGSSIKKAFSYHNLSKRAKGQGLAEVHLAKIGSWESIMGERLLWELEENLKRKEQSILLLNRRGYFTQVYCVDSKSVESCPACAVSLNLHRDSYLLCHYCGYRRFYDGTGSDGGATDLLGTGTQKLEDFLLHHFPFARIERLDSDTVSKASVLEDTLLRFLGEEIDILIGTQMIARGLDAPRVSLVGVLQAEKGLYLPDFRSAERTFSLLTQVAGRAGRSDTKGRVIFECFNPENPVIQTAASQDYESFYEMELPVRQSAFYPPFSRLVRLLCRGRDQERIHIFMEKLAALLKEDFEKKKKGNPRWEFEVLGPSSAPIEKMNNKFREHILIKSSSLRLVRQSLEENLFEKEGLKLSSKTDYLEIDMDPISLL